MLAGRQKSPFAPVRNTLVRVPGMSGAYVSDSQTDVLYIHQPIGFIVKGEEHALQLKDELASWLVTNEAVPLQFDDEPDRTYYAKVDGTIEDFNRFVDQRRGTITFLVPDGFSYGPEKTVTSTDDAFIVENNGTAESDPIFELTAKKRTTFALVSNVEEEYNLIGEPADDDVQTVDGRTSVLYENGSTINTWQTATLEMVDNHFVKKIDGSMGTDGAGIRANGYGTGSNLHGPAVYKEINPIQDFEIETTFDIISRRPEENWRLGINFLDENMNMLGHIGIKDNSRTYKRRVPLARFGPYRGSGQGSGNLIGDSQKNDNAREATLFYLRVKREGNTFNFYIGEWQNQKHVRHWEATYRDRANQFNGRLKYITLYITKWGDRPNPARLRINSVEVFELTKATVNQTPYIIYPGDVLVFDHKDKDILLNGESRKDLKAFGGSFFNLKKGFNNLIVSPENTFNTKVKFRERFR